MTYGLRMRVEASKAPKPRVQRVIGIVRRGSEILLVRESLGADGEILWSLPGGGVEDGELMHEALRRELKEETGLLVGDPVRTARAAIGKGAAAQSGRHGQQRPDRCPLRVCHVRRIPPTTFRVIDCVSEPVGDTITRWSSRVELHRRKHVELRQQGPLGLGWLRNPELPRGPAFMPAASVDHPIETPVRRTPLKIGTTTASN
ncbi:MULTISPECIES: NUDIX domain-containing protein [unclassified Streptomyces]|uniref:NUDIX domain-containing protein n=2 Tax=Streptomyces TaxID=1883 RepID=UPI0033857A75